MNLKCCKIDGIPINLKCCKILGIPINLNCCKIVGIPINLLTLSSPQTKTDTFVNSADPDETARLIRIYTICLSFSFD